jgi:hypothetical protein
MVRPRCGTILRTLFTAKHRRAFLTKRANAFEKIGRFARRRLEIGLELELIAEVVRR